MRRVIVGALTLALVEIVTPSGLEATTIDQLTFYASATGGGGPVYFSASAHWDAYTDCNGTEGGGVTMYVQVSGATSYATQISLGNAPWGWTNLLAYMPPHSNPPTPSANYTLTVWLEAIGGNGYCWQQASKTLTALTGVGGGAGSSGMPTLFADLDFYGSEVHDWGRNYVGDALNDAVSSIYLPTGYGTCRFWEHADYSGQYLDLYRYDFSDTTANLNVFSGPGPYGTWEDVISSWQCY